MNTRKHKDIDITLEKFEKTDGNHVFSDAYQKKKKTLVEAVKSKERAKSRSKMWKIAAAIAIVSAALPVTAYATNRLYHVFAERKGYQTEIHAEKDTVEAISPVELTATYLPANSSRKYKDGFKYDVIGEEGTYEHSVSVQLTKLDVENWTFESTYTIDYEEFEAGNHQAYLIHKDNFNGFNKEVCVVFDDYGYMVNAHLGWGISDEEAKKIAEGFRLEKTDEQHATSAASLAEQQRWEKAKGGKEFGLSSPEKRMYQVGEPVEFNEEGQFSTVTKVEVMENISSLDRNCFGEDIMVKLEEATDSSGNILAYDREIIEYGDGVNTLTQIKGTENVNRRLVLLTLEVTNSEGAVRSEEDMCLLFPINFFDEDGNIMAGESIEPIYFDASNKSRNSSRYYFTNIKEGETITCHLGYWVDEDKLGGMYLNSSFTGNFDDLVDIRQ